MHGRKKPRRPRELINPLAFLRPAPKAMQDEVLRKFLTAIEAIRSGSHPGEAEWRDLSDAINTVETLAVHMHKLVPAEVMPLVNAAIEAMVDAANHFKAGQGMRMSGPGLQAIDDVIDVYAQAMAGLTEAEMRIAQRETARRMAIEQRSPRTTAIQL